METGTQSQRLVVVPNRHVGRWASAAVALCICGAVFYSMVTNPRFQWTLVGHYFAGESILAGLGITIMLTAIAMLIGISLGTVVAIMRLSSNPVLKATSTVYVWFFRGIPPLVLLIFIYNISALYPRFEVPSPLGGHPLLSISANVLITSLTAAIIGLGLNETAYMAEIIRGGILSVPEGQVQAALSLGMTHLQVMRRIVLPQAMRIIIPPTGNETIGMLKMTSLVSVIALADLLYSTELIYSENFQTIPLLVVATIWYLVLTTILTVMQHYVEAHFGRSVGGSGGAGLLRTIGDRLVMFHGTIPEDGSGAR